MVDKQHDVEHDPEAQESRPFKIKGRGEKKWVGPVIGLYCVYFWFRALVKAINVFLSDLFLLKSPRPWYETACSRQSR